MHYDKKPTDDHSSWILYFTLAAYDKHSTLVDSQVQWRLYEPVMIERIGWNFSMS